MTTILYYNVNLQKKHYLAQYVLKFNIKAQLGVFSSFLNITNAKIFIQLKLLFFLYFKHLQVDIIPYFLGTNRCNLTGNMGKSSICEETCILETKYQTEYLKRNFNSY